jgi:hypothetical protein
MKNNLFKLATLAFCLVLLVGIGFAAKGKKTPSPMQSAAEEEAKEPAKKVQPTSQASATTPSKAPEKKAQTAPGIKAAEQQPTQTQPAQQIRPVEAQPTQLQPAPMVGDKGRQIKWQCVSGGGGAASASKGHAMIHTVGQGAVGYTSSGSYQAAQGFQVGGVGGGGGPEDRGDVNGDGIVNVGDVVYLVSYLYKGGPPPDPVRMGDCNCDDIVNVGDVVFLVSYLYKGGPEPVCP